MTKLRLWSFPGDKVRRARLSLLPNDDAVGCGISYIGLFEASSAFQAACAMHDLEFEKNEAGTQPKTRAQVDREFLDNMLAVAPTFRLRARAYVYFGLARTFGGLFW